MKKTLFVLFAVLVLICAVACSSSPKEALTGVQIDTTSVSTWINDNPSASEVKFLYHSYPSTLPEPEYEKITISLNDVKSGSVFVEMEPGVYEMSLSFYESGNEVYNLDVVTKTKFHVASPVTVLEGQITACCVEDDD